MVRGRFSWWGWVSETRVQKEWSRLTSWLSTKTGSNISKTPACWLADLPLKLHDPDLFGRWWIPPEYSNKKEKYRKEQLCQCRDQVKPQLQLVKNRLPEMRWITQKKKLREMIRRCFRFWQEKLHGEKNKANNMKVRWKLKQRNYFLLKTKKSRKKKSNDKHKVQTNERGRRGEQMIDEEIRSQ